MKTPKTGRPASGQVKWLRNVKTGAFCWHARFTLNGKRTKFAPLDRRIAEHDLEGARECARLAYEFLQRGGAVSDVVRETVAEYAERWLRSRKTRVRSVTDNESHLIHHVLPLIGSLDMQAITSASGDTIVARLDAKIEAGEITDKTARNIWGTAKKMFKDAAHAKPATGLRCIASHPWRDVSPPERVKTKAALQFLYPSEVVSVLTCPSPPRYFRRYIAIAVYLGLRDGEQRMLHWPNVDLQHGVIHVSETFDKWTGGTRDGTKSEAPRLVPIPAPLLPLLRAMHRESGGTGRVCPKMFGQPSMACAAHVAPASGRHPSSALRPLEHQPPDPMARSARDVWDVARRPGPLADRDPRLTGPHQDRYDRPVPAQRHCGARRPFWRGFWPASRTLGGGRKFRMPCGFIRNSRP
jgi:integrase